MEDYYMVLEVTQTASQEIIHKSYKRLALQHHPDKNMSNEEFATEAFQLLGRAYNTLKDENKRMEYDLQYLQNPTGSPTPFPTPDSASKSNLSNAELIIQINRRKATRASRWQKTKSTCEREIEELRREIEQLQQETREMIWFQEVEEDSTARGGLLLHQDAEEEAEERLQRVQTRTLKEQELDGKKKYLQFLELDMSQKKNEFEAQNEVDDLLQRMAEQRGGTRAENSEGETF